MKQITSESLKKWIAQEKDFCLIDIREKWERDIFNIGGLHIPMNKVLASMDEIPNDRDVVIYCEKGVRSVILIQRLEEKGFTNLINLSGGVKGFKESVDY